MASNTMAIPLTGSRTSPIKWWAGLGAAFYLLMFVTLFRWIAAGHAHPVDPGPDIPPPELSFWIASVDMLGLFFFIWMMWKFVIGPKLRTGKFTSDGLLILALALMSWQDPGLVYTTPWFNYNSMHFNLGNWIQSVPGALSINTKYVPEPLLTWTTAYTYFMMWIVLMCCWAMNWVKKRRPQTSALGLIGVAWVVAIVFDFVVEGTFLRTGGYSYAGSIRGISFWAGTTWQFPISEMLFWGAVMGACGCWRYFKDDKGYMLSERGADQLKASSGWVTFLRFLAISGALQLLMLVLYNIPMQWYGTHGDEFPHGMPSYLLNGMCGEGSDYACPGPGVPMPRGEGSMHMTPDNGLQSGKLPALPALPAAKVGT